MTRLLLGYSFTLIALLLVILATVSYQMDDPISVVSSLILAGGSAIIGQGCLGGN